MNVKSKPSKPDWVDPDDAPELDDAFFDNATPMVNGKTVTMAEFSKAAKAQIQRGRPKSAAPKQPLTVRYDQDVIEAFRATGAGWQTRMNDALRDWLKTHSPA